MPHNIRPAANNDLAELVQMSALSFEPIFASWKKLLGAEIYDFMFPDWKQTQQNTVETYFANSEKYHPFVTEAEGTLTGLLVLVFDEQTKTGEVEFLMVHPDYQKQGVGAALNNFALDQMREHGMELVTVGTGGDEGHTAARRSYEKAGYIPLPTVRYYKKL